MPIANFVPPLPGELLFSWFCRMADVNAISRRMFSARFLSRLDQEHPLPTLRYDSCNQLGGLLTEFGEFFSSSSEDAASFFSDHSMYGALAPFLHESQQQRLLSIMFGRNLERKCCHRLIRGRLLQACPKCMKENGIRYFRIHQLPGISICPSHGCRLLKYTDKVGNEFSEDAEFSETTGSLPSEKLEEQYAEFYVRFSSTSIDCSAEETELAIHKKMQEVIHRPFSSNVFNAWTKSRYGYRRNEFGLYYSQIVYSDNPERKTIPVSHLMMLVFLLFDSVEEFEKYLPHADTSK